MDLKKIGLLTLLLGKSATGLGQAPAGFLETTPSSDLIIGSERNVTGVGQVTENTILSTDDSRRLSTTLKFGLSNLIGDDGEMKPHHDIVQFALGITIAGQSYAKKLLSVRDIRIELIAQEADSKTNFQSIKVEFIDDARSTVGGKRVGTVDNFICVLKSGSVMVIDETEFSKHCHINTSNNRVAEKAEQQKAGVQKKSRGR